MAEVQTKNVGCGLVRITDDKVQKLRWKGGVLQYARYWSDGERQGHEWVDVPTEPADEPGVEVRSAEQLADGFPRWDEQGRRITDGVRASGQTQQEKP